MIQSPTTLAADVCRALDEDVSTDDVTVNLISVDANGQISLITRDPVVITGMPCADEVFRQLDSRVISIGYLMRMILMKPILSSPKSQVPPQRFKLLNLQPNFI